MKPVAVSWAAMMVCLTLGPGAAALPALEPVPGPSSPWSPGSLPPYPGVPITIARSALLVGSDSEWRSRVGAAVAVSGDTAVLGAPGLNASPSPKAYVFTGSGSQWSEQAVLTAPSSTLDDAFGTAVAIDGDTIVVGAPWDTEKGESAGAAYVFERSGGVWARTARLAPASLSTLDGFGVSVAISGSTIVVGAPGHAGVTSGQGAAYVYVRASAGWALQDTLRASDPETGAAMAARVAIDGDTIAASATRVSSSETAVYVFVRTSSAWTEEIKLFAPFPASGFVQRAPVALSGDTIMIGLPGASTTAEEDGLVYVYGRSGGVWSLSQTLSMDPEGADRFRFGSDVVLQGDRALIAALPWMDSTTLFLFEREGSTWAPTAELRSEAAFPEPEGGQILALDRTTGLFGNRSDGAQNGAGAGYVYLLAGGNPCSAPAECGNGLCIDGVCCASSCEGPCVACSITKKGGGEDGLCGEVAAGTDPDDECAIDPGFPGSCGGDGQCDGEGSCRTKAPDGLVCGEAICDGNEVVVSACLAGQCVAGSGSPCGLGSYCSMGVCEQAEVNGAECSAPEQCGSGYCVGGVCCDARCSSPGERCNEPGKVGQCVAIGAADAGPDADAESPPDGGGAGGGGGPGGGGCRASHVPAHAAWVSLAVAAALAAARRRRVRGIRG